MSEAEIKRMKVGKMLIIALLVVFVAIGLILIILGLIHGYSKIIYLKKAVRTVGTVIEVVEELTDDSESNNRWVYKPKVQFETKDGEVVTFISSLASVPSPYKTGDRVKVLYLYTEGQDINPEINSFMNLWFGPLFLLFMGSMFAIFFGLALRDILHYTGA